MNQKMKKLMRENPEKMKQWNETWGRRRAFASRCLNILIGSMLVLYLFYFLIALIQIVAGQVSPSWAVLLIVFILAGFLFLFIEYRSVIRWEIKAMGAKPGIKWWISMFLEKDPVPKQPIYDSDSGPRGWYSSIAFIALLFFEPTTLLFGALNASLVVFGVLSLISWTAVYLLSVVWEVSDFKQENGPGAFPFRVLSPWIICLCVVLFLVLGYLFLVRG